MAELRNYGNYGATLLDCRRAEALGEPPDDPLLLFLVLSGVWAANYVAESLLKSRRQVLHRRIAEALRDHFPAIAETEPEVVAIISRRLRS